MSTSVQRVATTVKKDPIVSTMKATMNVSALLGTLSQKMESNVSLSQPLASPQQLQLPKVRAGSDILENFFFCSG